MTRNSWIKEQLAARDMDDTDANRKTLGRQYDKIYVGGNRKDWRTYFKNQFPELAGLVDGDKGEAEARLVFGDLIDLFLEVAANPDNFDFDTTAGKDAWKVRVLGTKYGQQTSESRAQWDAMDKVEKDEKIRRTVGEIRGAYPDLGLTTGELENLALQRLRDNRSDLEMKYLAYSKLADRPGGGTLDETKESQQLVANLRALDYDYTPDQLRAALTGATVNGIPQSAELLTSKARYSAQQKYGAFAEQFKQGFTVADVFEPYQQIAANLLELPLGQVSTKNPMFRKALAESNPDGTPMRITDWEAKLKTDDEYGWRYTKNANRTINSVASTLERAFGLIQ